ncbi:hypothetical protein KAR91_53320 [Candidatus Pacearchaeota archaeon]|nr:hypothetical protein [Candidatus Pacearchaeota archaeon]
MPGIMNYQQLLEDVITPELTETVFKKDYDEFEKLFTKDPKTGGGSQIIDTQRTSEDSTARSVTRDDVNGVSGSFETVKVEWDKQYQDVTFEVFDIDISEAQNGGITTVSDLILDAGKVAMRDLKEYYWNQLYARLKADIDSSNGYGDNSISRSTYPTLASQEDNTDTPITLALLRSNLNAALLNRNTGGKSRYMHMMETSVYETFEPLAASLHTWNINDAKAGDKVDAGYQVIGNFEQVNVISPQGMTTGDLFSLRPEDVFIRNHMPLNIKQVESDRASKKFIAMSGITSRVKNPGFQVKQTLKD